MSRTLGYKPPVVLDTAPSYEPAAPKYVGFFGKELDVCSTIEEAIQSFEIVEERRRLELAKPFKYKG